MDKAIESNPVAAAILELMSTRDQWEGTAGELVGKLQALSADDPSIKKPTARGLGRWLSSKANQADLQAVGVAVVSYRSPGGKERGWFLNWTDRPDKHQKITSQISQMSQARQGAGSGCDIIQNGETDNVTTPPDNVTSPDKDPDCGQKFKPGQMVQWTDRPDNSLKIMSEMSETSGNTLKPAPDGHSSGGHYSDITGHYPRPFPHNVRQIPALEPAPDRHSSPSGDMTDLTSLIGGEVQYQGQLYTLMDYLPVSGRCVLDGGRGGQLIVPSHLVSVPDFVQYELQSFKCLWDTVEPHLP